MITGIKIKINFFFFFTNLWLMFRVISVSLRLVSVLMTGLLSLEVNINDQYIPRAVRFYELYACALCDGTPVQLVIALLVMQ